MIAVGLKYTSEEILLITKIPEIKYGKIRREKWQRNNTSRCCNSENISLQIDSTKFPEQ